MKHKEYIFTKGTYDIEAVMRIVEEVIHDFESGKVESGCVKAEYLQKDPIQDGKRIY